MPKPLILVTNDDGITAPGLQMLIRFMRELGEVVVVAPDSPQSGMGHAITLDSTLYSKKVTLDPEKGGSGIEAYSCSGTPADCVKLALQELLPRRPDLCVSGINHGSNASINVIYSGTMSAAIEAGIEGVPAIGFSLCDYSWEADFRPSENSVKTIAGEASGRDYYWLTGEFELLDKGEDTDEWALSQGYVSVVPTQFDLTAHHAIQNLNNWRLHESN